MHWATGGSEASVTDLSAMKIPLRQIQADFDKVMSQTHLLPLLISAFNSTEGK